ncbi:GntR family transcriptional regulator [Melghirimyces profundicolus]|uniref:GntR family transcriptional regulator n=1 Tax=Melghirimyces profundicolus TaxID=1242148 RepID=A0A2T6C8H8_9BACL|nr:GntR family transcriptional regulator [Melghirimyces profundicolus]PTX64603.1 GntR family transcriptional regulator [Melghirimyces profundicolus]
MEKKTSLNKQQYAYQILRSRILDGTYSPGYRLVINQIAKEMSLSAIPVREAIRQLEADGLIQYKPYSGAVVTPIDKNQYLETLSTLAVLEGYATALSSQCFPIDKIVELQKINERMKDSLEEFDFVRFGNLNSEFHDRICSRCNNQYLLENIRNTQNRLDSIRRMGSAFKPVRVKQSIEEHDELIRMLRESRPFGEIESFARGHKMNTVLSFQPQPEEEKTVRFFER